MNLFEILLIAYLVISYAVTFVQEPRLTFEFSKAYIGSIIKVGKVGIVMLKNTIVSMTHKQTVPNNRTVSDS